MAEHESSIGASDEWYTPREIFDALGLTFDLDPCAPMDPCASNVPAREVFTILQDGLSQPWHGLVYMNPPFGGRNGHVPWLEKFLIHANGIAVVRAYTSAGWFHDHARRAETMLFPRGKTKFIRPDGSVGKAPGHGIVLLGMGEAANSALRSASDSLGLFLILPR